MYSKNIFGRPAPREFAVIVDGKPARRKEVTGVHRSSQVSYRCGRRAEGYA